MPDLRAQLEALRRKLAEEAKAINRTAAIEGEPVLKNRSDTPIKPHDVLQRQQELRTDNPLDVRPTLHPPKPNIPNRSEVERPDTRPRLDVVIGLDFGTRFTKVAYRIVGVETTHTVVPDISNPDSALLKSVVFVDTATMTIHRKRPRGQGPTVEELPYLKLLLKDLNQPITLVPPTLRRMIDAHSIKVLAAFYLSDVLQSALIAIAQKEESRLKGRRVVYALNISLLARTRFRRHRVRCFHGTGGASWSGGSLRESSSLRRYG